MCLGGSNGNGSLSWHRDHILKTLHVYVRGEERKRWRRKVSQALRYFVKFGHSSSESVLNKET